MLQIKTLDEISYNCKVKILPNDRYKITCFSFGAFRDKGWELCNPQQRNKSIISDNTKDNTENNIRADSLKRAKDKIFEIALANKWDYMVTFTLDSEKIDRYDTKAIIKPFGSWLHNQVKRRNLKYIIVPEYHKDGAIHFHGLIGGDMKIAHSGTYKIMGEKRPIKLQTLKKRGFLPNSEGVKDVYNLADYKLGFSTAVKLDENVEAVAMYMTKYCTKDLGKIFGNFYFSGGKIERNLPSFLCHADFSKIEAATEIQLPNIFGKVKYLTVTGTDVEKVLEMIQ